MRACTSTSNLLGFLLLALGLSFCVPAGAAALDDRTQQSEENDHQPNAYTDYGDFNDDEAEANDLRFYQYGRLFGIQLGVGNSGATGNRGKLWSGGFPMLSVKTVYWFNFNMALDLDLSSLSHVYNVPERGGTTDVQLIQLGVNLRYSFDTRDAAAQVAFANPFVQVGIASYGLTQTTADTGTSDRDSAFGVSAGAGLEFALVPRTSYFLIDGRVHMVRFADTYTSNFNVAGAGNLNDLTGLLYTVGAHLLFTW